MIGFCAGGILLSGVLNHLAAQGDERVKAASFAVTLLDFDSRAAIGAFSAPRLLELAQKQSRRKGVITGRTLGNVFTWMRPDDLVFNYWVNNYLMGDDSSDLRHPRLERRQHEPAGAAARGIPRHLQEQHALPAGRHGDPRHSGGPQPDHGCQPSSPARSPIT